MISRHVPDLRKLPPFSALPARQCQYLQARLLRVEVPRGNCFLPRGKRGRYLAIIGSGLVELRSGTGASRILKPGETFGEGMLRYGVPSSFSATAKTDTVLWLVRRMDWQVAGELPPVLSPAQSLREYSIGIPIWIKAALLFLVLALLIFWPIVPELSSAALNHLAADAGRPDLAESYSRWVLYFQPDSAPYLESLGYALFLQDKYDQAIDAYQRAVSLDEESAVAQNNLGVALIGEMNIGQAVKHLLVAVELDPGRAALHYNLGNAYLAAGDHQSAARAYQQAFELDPTFVDARAQWALIHLEKDKTAVARTAWEKVLDGQPNHALAQKGLGIIAVMERNYAQALPHLEAARIADPQDGDTRLYLGLALEALDRPTDAAAEFEQALALSSDPELINLAMSRLQALRPQQ